MKSSKDEVKGRKKQEAAKKPQKRNSQHRLFAVGRCEIGLHTKSN
jgi:hypothetical protein